ncbi:MAG: outer membrane beta-barrel protein, partial [Bacteroidia bacterium]
LAAGGFIAIPINKYIGIQPEVLFSQKGFQSTGSILGSTYNLSRTTSYLDIPLLFAFKPSEFFTILAGPQYSYLLKQKDVFAVGSTTISQEQQFKNDNARRNTLCFTGGFDITVKHFVFGARAGWDLQTNNGNGGSSTPRYKNVWYQATIGIRFYSNN